MHKPLLSLTLLFCVVTAGCTGTQSDTPTVTPDTVTVSPGDSAFLWVRATDVAEMRVGSAQEIPGVELAHDDAMVVPRPDFVEESLPPHWVWDSPRHLVLVRVPVRVADDVTPGTYQFPVAARSGSLPRDTEVTANVTVVVDP
ncbi:hypothetical protein [Halogranum rubrum]|uniref:Uncharacterized protein n=1 Tax=Halogranum salarium B-1 TaxID=1210908 RepID=J3EWJ9_9EURY|nr:hypothetical protein [Halogranum salarium]EJN59257.1 hypothetical protein HSB1_26780 [Halogranum salarium B-1]